MFDIVIPNLQSLQDALSAFPSIAQPILQSAITGSIAILAKFTNASTVPVFTGMLMQNWLPQFGTLTASWISQTAYAPYVEYGTRPHIINVVNKRVLANVNTGDIFGPTVHHPGTAANPFIERIIAAATPEIDELFTAALSQITSQIAQSTP